MLRSWLWGGWCVWHSLNAPRKRGSSSWDTAGRDRSGREETQKLHFHFHRFLFVYTEKQMCMQKGEWNVMQAQDRCVCRATKPWQNPSVPFWSGPAYRDFFHTSRSGGRRMCGEHLWNRQTGKVSQRFCSDHRMWVFVLKVGVWRDKWCKWKIIQSSVIRKLPEQKNLYQ